MNAAQYTTINAFKELLFKVDILSARSSDDHDDIIWYGSTIYRDQ